MILHMLCAVVSLASVSVRPGTVPGHVPGLVPGLVSSVARSRSAGIVASLASAADVAAAKWLWASASKPLLRIGGKGAGPSHANGLSDLCSSQPYVCVRLTGAGASASLAQLVELAPSAPLAAVPGGVPVLLAHRAPRKGGAEALFARQEMVEAVLSADFREAAAESRRSDERDAAEWADERAASAAKQARKASSAARKGDGGVRGRRPNDSPSRTTGAQMGVGGAGDAKYASLDELEAAVRAYVAALPAGALDDASLPSPLSYKELQHNGRPDLVEGCMNFGGYLKLSRDFGLPVRIGVERSVNEAETSSLRSAAAKKTISAFNMFGKLDTAAGGLTEGEAAVGDAARKAAKKVAGLTGRILGLPDTGKW